MIVIIDDAAEMTKEMWEHLGKVEGERVMDIVDELRKDPYEEERQYKREARLELGGILDKAADEIERLREAMLEIVFLIGDSSRRQEIMDIAKPWAIQQVDYVHAHAALKEAE